MGSENKSIVLEDFSGGRNSFYPEQSVGLDQAIDLQNVNLLTKGFEKRQGNTAFNSSVMVDATTAIVGMGYVKFTSSSEYLNAVAGTKFFTSVGLSGTMADATGAVSITSGQNNYWTPVIYNDLQIWFGGAPDAPFKYSGSGNAAALGGSPPSAKTAFVANNRIFAISTTANPSRLQWPILGNPEDWTGTGSGSSDVSKNDGEELLFGVPITSDVAILFKNSSTHMAVLTRAPFPVYQLQKGEGAAGRYAYAFVNGTIYFITPSRRMKSTTDGRTFTEYPSDVNDLWDSVNSTRISNIFGIYYPNLRQIHWLVSTGSSTKNNVSIIWDLENECWLYHPTGFQSNVACLVQNRRLFTGHYIGKMFEQDKSGTFTDASESSPFAIDAYWQTPWMKEESLSDIIHPHWVDVSMLSQSTGTLTLSYGFDFNKDQFSDSLDMTSSSARWDSAVWDTGRWGGQTSVIRRVTSTGRGNTFSVKFRNASASQAFTVQAATIKMRRALGKKVISVS